uniref:protein-serine/threonine phosphatase n=1 Tax=Euplotes harpa TaxID=151035 RepID=A0A7S3NCJ8_9SPIT
MEDSHITKILDETPGKELAIFGVFDGHGGNQVAEWVRDNFVKEMVKLKSYKDADYKEALRETFIRMDELMKTPMVKKELQHYTNDKDNEGGMSGIAGFSMSSDADIANSVGCTACVCIVTSSEVICANSGDSRAVLSRKGVAVALSYDHKPDNPEEKDRITKAGGFVEENRVKGMLNLSRALGDLEYKLDPDLAVEDQMITCVPDIRVEKLDKNADYLIIACDGIWDCLTNQEAVDFVKEQASLLKKKSGSTFKISFIIEKMFEKIIAEDIAASGGLGCDNMTCTVIQLS